MPAVSLTISGRVYEVACDDSQADHIRKLAADLDERAQSLLAGVGQQPEARLLLMIALTLADELAELKQARDQAQAGLGAISASEDAVVKTLEELAGRIESIAHRLERS